MVRRAQQFGTPFDFSKRMIAADGSLVNVESVGLGIKDVSGKATKLILFMDGAP